MEPPKKWQRAELLIFAILTFLFALPFVATRFFPSMDGASHLVNSNIINQLLFYRNELFQQFFMLNAEPVPNWTGHFFISMLQLLLPAFLAEKLVVFLILTGTPFAFRYLLFTVAPKRTLYSFLVFPFTHSMFLMFGFYNFCLGILFLIITLSYWLNHGHHILTVRYLIRLTLLVALTYFSHIVVFGVLLILIAAHIVSQQLAGYFSGIKHKLFDVDLLRRMGAITIASLVPLLLFGYFFYSRPETREIKFLSRDELVGILTSVRPLVSLNPVIEGKLLKILFFAMVFTGLCGAGWFVYRLFRRVSGKRTSASGEEPSLMPDFHFWWLLSSIVILLILFFTLPDAYGTASYTNLRLAFLIFLLAILWFATFRIPWYIGVAVVAAGLYVNVGLIRFYRPSLRELGKLADSCNKAAEFTEPNSIILPIYCMDNWFTGHFVDYIAVDKPLVMVYNYECESGYFPVVWNREEKPNYYMGNPMTPEKYIHFEVIKGNPSRPLNYVFIVGHYDPSKDWFFGTLHAILTSYFDKVYEAENCALYKNRLTGINR